MSDNDPQFASDDVEIVARETSFESFLRIDTFQIKHRLFEGGWSATFQRELLVKTPAIGVLLFDPERDELVLVRQFRIGMLEDPEIQSPWPLELVAGLVDKDETLEEVAIRETEEETGLAAHDIRFICDYYNSPGASSEKVTLFCARVDASKAGGYHGLSSENEDIQVVVQSSAAVLSALAAGEINNAMSIVALQWFAAHRQSLVQDWQ